MFPLTATALFLSLSLASGHVIPRQSGQTYHIENIYYESTPSAGASGSVFSGSNTHYLQFELYDDNQDQFFYPYMCQASYVPSNVTASNPEFSTSCLPNSDYTFGASEDQHDGNGGTKLIIYLFHRWSDQDPVTHSCRSWITSANVDVDLGNCTTESGSGAGKCSYTLGVLTAGNFAQTVDGTPQNVCANP